MTVFIRKVLQPFTQTQTYLNLAYLVENLVFGSVYLLILLICLPLAWGLAVSSLPLIPSLDLGSVIKAAGAILGGVLVIPVVIWLLQLFVVSEQWFANVLLKEQISLDREMWSKRSTLWRPGRLFGSTSTWKRLAYMLLKIPLGALSGFTFLLVLLPILSLLWMPVIYLAGFQDLIIGTWRFDSTEKTLLAFLAGIILLPLSVYAMNYLAKFCGWLVRIFLVND